jgi:hypothetical protein
LSEVVAVGDVEFEVSEGLAENYRVIIARRIIVPSITV